MWAIALKEFRQLRRDRRTVAMLFLFPFLFLVVFGYAASFDVKEVPTIVVGPGAPLVAAALPAELRVVATRPGDGAAQARDALRRGEAVAAIVTPSRRGRGAAAATSTAPSCSRPRRRCAPWRRRKGPRRKAAAGAPQPGAIPGGPRSRRPASEILFNPDLRTAVIMIPGLCGIILVFVGHRGHGPRRRARTPGGDHGTARRHAVPPARRLRRQDRAVHGHRRPRHGDRGRGRHAALRRALPRLGRRVRARLRALPVRHPGHRRAHLHGVADPGAGHPAGDDDPASPVPAQRPLLPPLLDGLGRALDRLPPAADLLHQGGARGHGARRAHRRTVGAARRARRDGARGVHRLDAALSPRSGAGRRRGRRRAGRSRAPRRVVGGAGGDSARERLGRERPHREVRRGAPPWTT